MQLQNFECQIAKAQIGRYLAGDALSEEAVEQLEAHIAKCPDCKRNLAERRAVLQAMLSPGEPDAQTQQEQTPKGKFDLADFIKSKIKEKQPVQAAVAAPDAKPTSFTKPALYSVALGVVLIGMSYASRNLDSLTGPKAANTQPKTTETTPAKPISQPKPANTNAVTISKPLPKTTPPAKPKADPPKPVVTPKVEVKKTRVEPVREPKRKSRHKAPRHASSNTIRVYEPEN